MNDTHRPPNSTNQDQSGHHTSQAPQSDPRNDQHHDTHNTPHRPKMSADPSDSFGASAAPQSHQPGQQNQPPQPSQPSQPSIPADPPPSADELLKALREAADASYVESYKPPSDHHSGDHQPDNHPSADQSDSSQRDVDQPNFDQPHLDQPATGTPDSNPPPPPQPSPTQDSESLESQNIFELLGVSDGTDQDKEAFLDELQSIIWEDFLADDVKSLITEEEQAKLQEILQSPDQGVQPNDQQPDDQQQNDKKQQEVVNFLEPLIPDLEEIMLEKALELKADLFKERLLGMRDLYAGQEEVMRTIEQAEEAMADDKWRTATQLLNEVRQ